MGRVSGGPRGTCQEAAGETVVQGTCKLFDVIVHKSALFCMAWAASPPGGASLSCAHRASLGGPRWWKAVPSWSLEAAGSTTLPCREAGIPFLLPCVPRAPSLPSRPCHDAVRGMSGAQRAVWCLLAPRNGHLWGFDPLAGLISPYRPLPLPAECPADPPWGCSCAPPGVLTTSSFLSPR